MKGLFRKLDYHRNQYPEYRAALQHLIDNGQVIRIGRRQLGIPQKQKTVRGRLRLTPHGYGFVDREEDSIFISAAEARQAYDGDEIEVSIVDVGHSAGPAGHIISVDEEKRLPLLARLRHRGGETLADVKTGDMFFTVRIDNALEFDKLKSGNWALVEAPESRKRHPIPSCDLKRQLGNPFEKGVAERGLLLSSGFDETYPPNAVKESEVLKVTPTRHGIRRDLTNEFVVTIDPADAKDHDDAVSLRRDDQGNWLLGIHIADISRYVPEGSEIDKAARERGFSVYLQHHHLPMLPPRLPGELCSLKTGKDRLALSVLITLSKDATVLKTEITPSKVRIRKLLSYVDAQDILDGKMESDPETVNALRTMWSLASKLNKQRLKEGGVEFDLPEAGFRWDGGAVPRKIFRQPRLQTHRLIEEFMLAANRAVAEIWTEKFGAGAPYIYRVHEPPSAEKRQRLSDYLADAGFDWPPEKLTTAKQITEMLDEVYRRFPIEVTSNIARKTLMLARYDIKPKGHFGLGFKHYLHFTSPIRRYSDLMVHRLIWKYLIYDKENSHVQTLESDLQSLCQHLSEKERTISELEREAIKLTGLLYLNERKSETFKAKLIDVSHERMFMALEDLFIEGALTEDCGIQFESKRQKNKRSPRGQRSTRTLGIGDQLEVTVEHIDFLSRKLDLQPV
ncbi:VacB/RNase II family 3'-5' exoribonuclease [bacterium]|nr:VacB/RNase II family 3'-5' exoribonuclease [bacterium]